MTDPMLILTVGTVATVVQAIFWRWVSSISEANKAQAKKIENLHREIVALRNEIYKDYSTKTDFYNDRENIMQSLARIESNIDKINDKLDKKADK